MSPWSLADALIWPLLILPFIPGFGVLAQRLGLKVNMPAPGERPHDPK